MPAETMSRKDKRELSDAIADALGKTQKNGFLDLVGGVVDFLNDHPELLELARRFLGGVSRTDATEQVAPEKKREARGQQ